MHPVTIQYSTNLALSWLCPYPPRRTHGTKNSAWRKQMLLLMPQVEKRWPLLWGHKPLTLRPFCPHHGWATFPITSSLMSRLRSSLGLISLKKNPKCRKPFISPVPLPAARVLESGPRYIRDWGGLACAAKVLREGGLTVGSSSRAIKTTKDYFSRFLININDLHSREKAKS